MSDSEGYRKELREAVRSFACGQQSASSLAPGAASLPRHINVYLFGPQGSGKTSFIRTCFRALYGPRELDAVIKGLEHSLHRSDDGTSMYSVYSLTERICLHDTRGQREYTKDELQQLKLVLEGRARPNSLVQQRRRYWLLLREFWRTDEQMRRTFSKTVMLPKASLDTEPHFAFLVLDPNQQELLLEDADFRECYGSLVSDFDDRGVPHALLCTHGDTLNPTLRASLLRLPELIGCRSSKSAQAPAATHGPGGVQRPVHPPHWQRPDSVTQSTPQFHAPFNSQNLPNRKPPGDVGLSPRHVPPPPPAEPSPFDPAPKSSGSTDPSGMGSPGPSTAMTRSSKAASEPAQQLPKRMPDIMRIVTNYTDTEYALPTRQAPKQQQKVEFDKDGNEIQQDIHTLLVLLDALRQADNHIMQRMAGKRPAPMPTEAETGCPLL